LSGAPRVAAVALDGSPEARARALTAWVGMVVFIASSSILFAATLVAYASLRSRAPGFLPRGIPTWPFAMAAWATLALVPIPVVLGRAVHRLATASASASARHVAVASGLGAAFMALQTATAAHCWTAGLRPATCTYGALAYALYGLHGAHVATGTLALGALAWTARRRTALALASSLGLWRLYFRFLAIVWIAILALLYSS
jgi:heme/copper-type cytochrome/quinol oxidase subunit 3